MLRRLLRKLRKIWGGFSDGHGQGQPASNNMCGICLDTHQFLVLSNLKY